MQHFKVDVFDTAYLASVIERTPMSSHGSTMNDT